MHGSTFNLLCLPFAGGSSYSCLELEKHTAPFVRVQPIELPGRGRRFADPLLTDIHHLAQDVLNQAKSAIMNGPYALYGHSFGARLAYVLTRSIARAGLPMPSHLFVSGSPGPSVPPKNRNRHLLPKQDFFKIIEDLGGTPREVLQEKALMDLFEPILRADFQANDTYAHRRMDPLTQPMTVMIGDNDKVSYEEAVKWRDETSGEVQVQVFSGGHFFIFDHWRDIGGIISRKLGQ